jgi:hypothetical protein
LEQKVTKNWIEKLPNLSAKLPKIGVKSSQNLERKVTKNWSKKLPKFGAKVSISCSKKLPKIGAQRHQKL